MSDTTISMSSVSASGKRLGLLGLIPLVKSRRTVLVLTILSGILAQTGTIASLVAGAWLTGRAVTGAAPEALTPGFWLLAAFTVVAACGRWLQAYISHDLAFALIETIQVGIYDGLERAAPAHVLGKRTG
jgi:ATP-binding cassette subfamily C protein CydCD